MHIPTVPTSAESLSLLFLLLKIIKVKCLSVKQLDTLSFRGYNVKQINREEHCYD